MAEFTDSAVYTVTTDTLDGFTLFDLADTDLFSETYFYISGGRSEALSVMNVSQSYLTFAYQETNFSSNSGQAVALTLVLPFGDEHDSKVRALRTALRSRRVLGYRDNRSRLHAGIITNMTINDLKYGTSVGIQFNIVNYPGVS